MIEDKNLGLKVAENKDIALWNTIIKEALMLIEQSQQNIKVQSALLETAREKLKLEEAKNGTN